MIKPMYIAVLFATGLASAAVFAQGAAPGGAPSPQGAATQPPPANAASGVAPTPAPAVTTGDPGRGRERTAMCQGCHGIEGWRTAYPEVYRVPMLGGQHEAYLVKALQAYKSGERSHPSMRGIAASLSDQDMADLAAYYAQRGVKTAAAK